MIDAVILAAGASARMGSPKALLLDPDGTPFIVRSVRTLHAAGFARPVIVTGVHHDAIAATLEGRSWNAAGALASQSSNSRDIFLDVSAGGLSGAFPAVFPDTHSIDDEDDAAGVALARNPDPSRGQLSSLQAGLAQVVTADTEALLVMLVDVPMVTADTVRAVAEAWRTSRAPIVRPVVGARHGHPVMFDRQLFEELRQAPLDVGAKAVMRAHADAILDLEVTDEGCLVDVDTPEEYAALTRRNREG